MTKWHGSLPMVRRSGGQINLLRRDVRDAIVFFIIGLTVLAVSVHYDLPELVLHFALNHEDWHIDDLLYAGAVLNIFCLIYGFRRYQDFSRLLVSRRQMQEVMQAQAESLQVEAGSKDREHAKQIAQRQDMEQKILEFRGSVENMLRQAHEMTERMNATAGTLSTISKETNTRAHAVTSAADETSHNVAIVAASSEELGVSVRAIAERLVSASEVVRRGSDIAHATTEMIMGLAESTKRIDDVVGLIRSIADQTNLLALNATIESARAGEMGRGFAVVAFEVKALATQTAKATEDISGQISEVQSWTGNAVERITSLVSIMKQISAATGEITQAVQQQGIATDEISHNTQGVASATQEVARNIAGTTSAIGETNQAMTEVLKAAEYITKHTRDLNASVDQFLRGVAAA